MNKCPNCGSTNIEINETVTEVPCIGKVLVYSFVCKDCGYKKSGYLPMESKESVDIKFTVKSKDDFYKKIVKSPTGTIILEEIEMEVIPGRESQMWIKNVDSFINDMINVLEMFKRFNSDDKNKVREINDKIKYLQEVLEGKKTLTIRIIDENGLSRIVDNCSEK